MGDDVSMIVVNTETVPGMRIVRVCGLVQGNTVRAKNIGRDLMASLKNVIGGELVGYTELLQESRTEAVGRMLYEAQQYGANAVLNVRFATSSITAGAAELYCYGTAVVLEPETPAVAPAATVAAAAAVPVPRPPVDAPVSAPVVPPAADVDRPL